MFIPIPASEYLLVANEVNHERFFSVEPGPIRTDHLALILAYEHMRSEGLKEAYLYRANETRWMARMELS